MKRKYRLRDVIYDWNQVDSFHQLDKRRVSLLDETLRDGIQATYVRDPDEQEKLELLRLMNQLGIQFADVGLPAAGPRAAKHSEFLVRGIADEKMQIQPCMAARTLRQDIEPIADIVQRTGVSVEVMAFIGSSPIRMITEEWDLDFLVERSTEAIDFARREGLEVTFVTEDTTRSRPEVLYKLISSAVDHGANRICIADTTGHATPDGIRALMRFVFNLLTGLGVSVGVDWHGHNDRALSMGNALWALQWGADRVHATALGVGERAGNTSMEQLIANLRLLGAIGSQQDLTGLVEYCRKAAKYLEYQIPPNHPLAGDAVFRTATGVHAAATLKALAKGEEYLADRIYSGVPASMFGRRQEVVIGPMSGKANCIYYLQNIGVDPSPELVDALLKEAKRSNRILSADEVRDVLAALGVAIPSQS